MTRIVSLLSDRGRTHGDALEQARIAQDIKDIIRESAALDPLHQECLEMIALKISRILAGDPCQRDHWDDISGYAQLVATRLP